MHEILENDVLGAGGGCFRKGARVQLQHGKTVAIEDVREGDEVLSFNEHGDLEVARVTKVHFHDDPQPILRVRFWRGETHITPNHWVLNQYGGFAEISRLTDEDALVDGMGHLAPVVSKTLIGHEPVYNLTVEPNHTFICDGIRVHNGGHRALWPEVAGAGGSGKGSGRARVPIEDDDSAQSRQRVGIIDLLGEGISGGLVDGAKSILINGTPLQNDDGSLNWNGVEWDFRAGTLDQTPMLGFPDIESPHAVGVQVKTTSPAVVAVTNPLADQVRMVVAIPSMITQDKENGDIHGASVSYRFDISLNDGTYQIGQPITLSYKARSRTQRQHVLTLPKSGFHKTDRWTIRMVRLSADSTSSTLTNDTYLDSYAEIINARLSYPGSVLVGLRINSEFFSSIPSRSYLIRGSYIRVPSNYDAATKRYVGIWDGTFKLAVSGNPAWIMLDVLTDKRHGLGQYISDSQVDIASLYRIGRYCDEMVSDGKGGLEPRFAINTQIQTQVGAYQFLSDLSSAFRGMVYWNGSQVSFTQDAPGEVAMVYTPSNVINGAFTRSGSEREDRHSVVRVKWNDRQQRFKQNVEYVEDQDLVKQIGIRALDLVGFGCASRGMANRIGKWVLYTEQHESNTWQFTVGLDSAFVFPGEIIKIHDPTYAGKRMGGRAVSATNVSVELDAPLSLAAPGASISIRMPDGTFVERFVSERVGTFTSLSWATPLPSLPVPGAIWLVTEPGLDAVSARVLNVEAGEQAGQFRITALQHNASKFDAIEKGLKLQDPPVSVIDTREVLTPTDFKVLETPVLVAPGVMGLSLVMSWSANASFFEVTWRRVGKYETNWESVTTANPMFEIPNVRAGQHQFKIIAINGFGRRSRPFTGAYTTVGKTAAPGDVANFKVTKRTNDLLLTWNEVSDITLKGYEVRVGPSWEEGSVLTTNFAGTMLTHDQDDAGIYLYHIRSISVDDVYSDNVSTYELTLNAPVPVEGLGIIQSSLRLELAWKSNPEPDIAYYEIREGETWANGILIAQVKATSHSIPSGTIGSRTFWVKAVGSPGIYSDLATFVTTDVAMPTNSNIVFTTEESLLGWPGYKLNMRQVGYDLMMVDGVGWAEYGFSIDLLDTYRAQNSSFIKLNSVIEDTDSVTWATSLFSWESPDAIRSWAPNGNIESVAGRFQIARKTGLQRDELDGWTLRDTLTSVVGKKPGSSSNPNFAPGGRYGNGFQLTNGAQAEWADYALVGEFTHTLFASINSVNSNVEQTIASLRDPASGVYMRLSYSEGRRSFILEDSLGQEVAVAIGIAAGDVLLIAISQAIAERRLFVAKLGGEVASSIAPLAPFPKISRVGLNWPT